jgi:hypothetical protein
MDKLKKHSKEEISSNKPSFVSDVKMPFKIVDLSKEHMNVVSDVTVSITNPEGDIRDISRKKTDISLDDPYLFSTQNDLYLDLEKLKSLNDKKSNVYLPIVVEFPNGVKLIQDGHHRLSYLKIIGKNTALVELFKILNWNDIEPETEELIKNLGPNINEMNTMGSGAVVGFIGPIGMDLSPIHKAFWSGDKPEKNINENNDKSLKDLLEFILNEEPIGKSPLIVGDEAGLNKIHDEMQSGDEELPLEEEFIGKKGGLSYFQMGASLPDELYNKTNDGKPTRDPGIGTKHKSKRQKANSIVALNECVDHSVLPNMIKDFVSYAKPRMKFNKSVSIVLKNNIKNAENPLGMTAAYEPMTNTIIVYISDRHPKDIMRSIAHELVHHAQNCRGEFSNHDKPLESGYAQKDEHLRNMEKEAYQTGNLVFRDWEDARKKSLPKL